MNKTWSAQEVNFLKEHYKNMSSEEMSKFIDKTPKAIKNKIQRENLFPGRRLDWSIEEINTIINFPELNLTELSKLLQNHTIGSIKKKRQFLNKIL